jgi:hypothetical protein
VDDDSPWPGGDANGVWNALPETPATSYGTLLTGKAPPKKQTMW